jgi:hypothetical protein
MHRVERLVVYPVLALLCAAVFLRLAPVVADAPADGTFGVLTVREVRVAAEDGTVVARLAGDGDGGTFAVGSHPSKGKGGFVVDTLAGVGRAYARNAEGTDVAFVGAAHETQMGLVYASGKGGKRAAEITAGEKGGYTMHYGAGGETVAFTGAASDTGTGILIVWNTSGVRGAELAYGTAGGYLVTNAPDGKQTAFLGTATDQPVGLLSLHRGGGTRTLLMHGTEDGATIRALKVDGTEVFQAGSSAAGGKVTLTDSVGTVTLPLRK